MKNTRVLRPEEDINVINDIFIQSPRKITISLNSGSVLDSNSINGKSAALLESGVFSLKRRCDDKHILYIEPPFPFGIIDSLSQGNNYYIETCSTSKVSFIPRDEFISDVNEKNLWRSISKILVYLIDVNDEYIKSTVMSTKKYDIIKLCLKQIWALPDDVRENTSIYEYISQRHKISRSSVSKIIRDLVGGEYIKVNRGRLIGIKKLPESY